ncbi:MAG: RloB family protein [Roseburia sp.]|nr:RloB family protein [Roseburia sp.]
MESPEELSKKERNQFATELRKIGYDINYRKYLNTYKNDMDEFGILIDRDMLTHSREDMYACIKHCKDSGYNCYISNPCFEFWLLLHLSDVKEEYKDRLDEILKNEKISQRHTFVSKEVSDRAHHNKGTIHFSKNYLPYIFLAAERAKSFEGDTEKLIDSIGCNLWKLIEEMQGF